MLLGGVQGTRLRLASMKRGWASSSASPQGSVCSGSDLKPRPPIAFLQSLGQPALFCSRVRTHERLTDLYALTETVLGTGEEIGIWNSGIKV